MVISHRVFGKFGRGFVAVFFVMLRAVESDFLAVARYAHRYHLVGQPVEGVAHYECIGADHDQGKYVHPEKFVVADHVRILLGEIAVGEDSGEHCAEDAAETVGGKYVKRIVKRVCTALHVTARLQQRVMMNEMKML